MTKPFDPLALRIGLAYRRGLAAHVEAGKLLAEKKASLRHGQWLPWLRRNADALGFDSDRTAQRLIKLAAENPTLTTDLTDAHEITRKLWGNGPARSRATLDKTSNVTVRRLRQTILCGDAHDKLKTLPDQSVHVVVTSPPYYRKKKYDGTSALGWEVTVDEYLDKLTAILGECKRILADAGTLWVNIDDTLVEKSWQNIPGRLVERLRADGWLFRHTYIWNKRRGFSSARDRLRNSHEHLFGFTKQERYYFDDVAIRAPHKYKDSRRKTEALDAMPGSVLEFPTAVDPVHPAVFDESLAAWCIRASCPKGGLVLDPFAGAGASGVAARNLGRSFVGVEISPRYVERAWARISEVR
jgi:DNA modification methylase